MNLASEGGDPSSGVFFVNFNQDATSLAVGTKIGYRLYHLNAVEKLDQIFQDEGEDLCIVERLFSSSLVAIVSLSSPRKLKILHFKKGTEICNYSYSNTILVVKLNRARLVVCLEESLYIHNIRDMKLLHTIRETPPNPRGLCALSTSNENCYLAYPGSSSVGEIQIFDAVNLQAKLMIPAHDNPLAAMAFNSEGTKIASASIKGTVIRIFNVFDGTKLFEFRRGVKRCVNIYSLAFSMDSMFLCASSNTETVHVFKLTEPSELNEAEEPQGWMGYFGKALMQSASYLPAQVTDMFNQGRSFATVTLPFSGLKNVCALAVIQEQLTVLVASADGYLYIYSLDTEDGGDCTMLKQHRLDCQEDTSSNKEGGATVASGADRSPNPASGSSAVGSRRPVRTPGTTSYAAIVRGGSDSGSQKDGLTSADHAHSSPSHGSLGSVNNAGYVDESEFPPMSHTNE